MTDQAGLASHTHFIHFLGRYFSVWLDRVASSRNSIKTINFSWFSAIGSREASDRIGFLRNAVRSRQTEKTHLANVLKIMLARLQRLGPSERWAVPVQRSDFAEKLCFMALGSEERSPFVAQACSGATKLAADASMHLPRLNVLRLARSCRVVEKFDKNHRFFMIFCDRAPRSERSDRISP